LARKPWPLRQILLVLAVTLLAGCTASRAPAGTPHGPSAPASPTGHTPAQLLTESWASNGERGFFINAAGPPGYEMSLYQTAWWLRVAGKRAKVDPEAVGEWLLPVLYGSSSEAGLADTAGLPTMAVLRYATNLAADIQADIDSAKVDARIDSLRDNNLYKSSATASSGDWTSTAVAVSILGSLGRRPPDTVTSHLADQLPVAISLRDRGRLSTFVVPLLSTMSDQQIEALGHQLRATLSWVQAQLPLMTPLERLSAASALRSVIHRAGAAPWSATAVCAGLRSSTEGVQISADTLPDPQATAQALEAGCAVEVTPPPWTTAGWPNDQAVSGARQASVAGLRVVGAVGVRGQYADKLRRQMTEVWLPSSSADSRGLGDLAGTTMLCRLLDLPTPRVPDLDDPLATAVDQLGLDSLPVLLVAHLNKVTMATTKGQPFRAW
jgi:hypothetical protein